MRSPKKGTKPLRSSCQVEGNYIIHSKKNKKNHSKIIDCVAPYIQMLIEY